MSAAHACHDSSDDYDNDHGGDDGAPPPIDYAPLRAAARAALAWVLDVARSHVTEDDDREAIDRVEHAALATLDDRPAHASHEDLLVTLGILIERFELDFRIPGLSQIFGGAYDAFDWLQRSVAARVASGSGVSNHATHRHADFVSVARAIADQFGRSPLIADGENRAAHVLVFRVR